MDLFTSGDYKAWLNSWVSEQPSGGRGQYKRIAEHLGVSTVLISQVFKGPKDLTPEQAWDLCDYVGMTPLQSEYFLALVQRERSGTERLRSHWDKKAQNLRQDSRDLSKRLPKDRTLSPEEQAQFYSNWYYSAIRLLSSIEGYSDPLVIAERLNLPTSLVAEVVQFLLATGLCVQADGKLSMGHQRTHLSKESHLVRLRNADWRTQAIERVPNKKADELFFSAPMSINENDIPEVQRELLEAIEKVSTRVQQTHPTEVVCLNIDWFRV